MNTIERMGALRNFAHEIGFLFLGANEYKENYVSDMYFMLRRFFTNEIEIMEHYENKKYCKAIEESFIEYLNHAPEYLRDIQKVEKFYDALRYVNDSLAVVAICSWGRLVSLIRRCKSIEE